MAPVPPPPSGQCLHPELSNCTQQLHISQTKCILVIALLLVGAISRSIESIDVAFKFKKNVYSSGKFTNVLVSVNPLCP